MKRINVRSSFAVALLLALILPILAACGGSTTSNAENAKLMAMVTLPPFGAMVTARS